MNIVGGFASRRAGASDGIRRYVSTGARKSNQLRPSWKVPAGILAVLGVLSVPAYYLYHTDLGTDEKHFVKEMTREKPTARVPTRSVFGEKHEPKYAQ